MFYKIAILSRNQKSYDSVSVFSLVKVCITVHLMILFDESYRLISGVLFVEGTSLVRTQVKYGHF